MAMLRILSCCIVEPDDSSLRKPFPRDMARSAFTVKLIIYSLLSILASFRKIILFIVMDLDQEDSDDAGRDGSCYRLFMLVFSVNHPTGLAKSYKLYNVYGKQVLAR